MMVRKLILLYLCFCFFPQVARAATVMGLKEVQRFSDVEYGTKNKHKMDVYTLKEKNNLPIILMVSGEEWKDVEKRADENIKRKIQKWVPEGFVFISMEYRTYPIKAYSQTKDIGKALAFIQTHASKWGGDPTKIILMGHSSGAHLVSLISSNPQLAYKQSAKPWLGSIILDSIAMNVPDIMGKDHPKAYDMGFGNNVSDWKKASPEHQLTFHSLPMLLVCSKKKKGFCPMTESFAAHAQSKGRNVSLLPLNLSHSDINENLGDAGAYTDQVDAFIQSLLER